MAQKIDTVTLSCPNQSCMADFEVPVRELHNAAEFAASHRKPIATACTKCCHVVILPSAAPINPDNLQEWIDRTVDSENWLECLPLPGNIGLMPAGYISQGGTILYSPVSGENGLERRNYMLYYGIDPLCQLAKQGRAPKGF